GAERVSINPVDSDAYVVVGVAKAFARSVQDVMEQPWALTLWTWMELTEYERISGLVAEQIELHGAFHTALAFHEPKRLKDEEWEWKKRAGLIQSAEEAFELARQMIEGR